MSEQQPWYKLQEAGKRITELERELADANSLLTKFAAKYEQLMCERDEQENRATIAQQCLVQTQLELDAARAALRDAYDTIEAMTPKVAMCGSWRTCGCDECVAKRKAAGAEENNRGAKHERINAI